MDGGKKRQRKKAEGVVGPEEEGEGGRDEGGRGVIMKQQE